MYRNCIVRIYYKIYKSIQDKDKKKWDSQLRLSQGG